MNNEMQSMTPFDSFGDVSDLGMSQPGGNPESRRGKGLFSAVHRALRGRYWIVVPAALLCAAAGALFGWRTQKPIYKSDGSVQVMYKLDSPFLRNTSSSRNEGLPMYEEFLMTQTYVITSRNVVNRALKYKDWMDTGRGDNALVVKQFVENLIVEHPRQTQAIHIAYMDNDPGVAAAAVRSITHAYEEMYAAGDLKNEENKLNIIQTHIADTKLSITAEKSLINSIANEYGGDDFSAIYQNKTVMVNDLDIQLGKAKLALKLRESKEDPSKIIETLTLDQIGMLDNTMSKKMDFFNDADTKLHQLELNQGPRNPKTVEMKAIRESAYAAAEKYGAEYRQMQKKLAEAGADSRGGIGPRLNQSKESLEAEVASLTEMLRQTSEEMKTVGNKQREIERRREHVKEFQDELKSLEAGKSNIVDDGKGDGRLRVISYGEFPILPFKDRRKSMAMACAAGAGALPIALLMMLGFMDKRFRYSDEADGAEGMPPLLGILPTLPDRLSDPEQAAVAAHCIHQLRIMLQVNGGAERKTFMITSASAGDGKTSLTMALGLSFAASGSRTLVIDCDMVGQGLTTRLKARNSPGLLEALGAGTLNQRVKKTTTPNLFILPIGGAESAHAGGLSPTSIRKLLTEARRIFDTVLIDTGPILGSLEAAVVGAAADAVILAMARGQHQTLVERSVRQLRQVGANVIGLVFNRAEKRDFQRSVGSSSIRSVSLHAVPQRMLISEGAEESRFGPLARSVASFMPGAGGVRELPPANGPHVANAAPSDEIRVDIVSRNAEDDDADEGVHEAANGRRARGESR